ncbi:MAG: LEA type 2 family protein [Polyangiaceae bacterium]
MPFFSLLVSTLLLGCFALGLASHLVPRGANTVSVRRRTALLGVMLALGASFASAGCSKPQPPTITPKKGTIQSVGPTGVTLRLEFDAYNPNGFDLNVQSVKAKVTFDSSIKLSEVTSPTAISLPSKATSPLTADVTIPFNSLPALMSLAASKTEVPYVIEGTVTVGGKSLNVNLPFTMKGVVTQQQLVTAGMNSLQGLPGLKGLIPGQ